MLVGGERRGRSAIRQEWACEAVLTKVRFRRVPKMVTLRSQSCLCVVMMRLPSDAASHSLCSLQSVPPWLTVAPTIRPRVPELLLSKIGSSWQPLGFHGMTSGSQTRTLGGPRPWTAATTPLNLRWVRGEKERHFGRSSGGAVWGRTVSGDLSPPYQQSLHYSTHSHTTQWARCRVLVFSVALFNFSRKSWSSQSVLTHFTNPVVPSERWANVKVMVPRPSDAPTMCLMSPYSSEGYIWCRRVALP